ncbi:hypothetical protein G8759_20710 [Spirosoma aureum]|uniref:Uncharacterized protein n=1 Tax=Spirosoma aureum TaxID=2692134 RepID=A0A6G9AQW7_9BACT|nr:hypothetical protein [Spirosoma aureum]QIP14867.1 hypothetical protein G8759_20710 [Spirosoma aureum]
MIQPFHVTIDANSDQLDRATFFAGAYQVENFNKNRKILFKIEEFRQLSGKQVQEKPWLNETNWPDYPLWVIADNLADSASYLINTACYKSGLIHD